MSVTWESRSKGFRGKPGDGLPSMVFKADSLTPEAKAEAKRKAQKYAGLLKEERVGHKHFMFSWWPPNGLMTNRARLPLGLGIFAISADACHKQSFLGTNPDDQDQDDSM